jgi:hypothetical protein
MTAQFQFSRAQSQFSRARARQSMHYGVVRKARQSLRTVNLAESDTQCALLIWLYATLPIWQGAQTISVGSCSQNIFLYTVLKTQ